MGSAVAEKSFSLNICTYSPPPNLPPNLGDSLLCCCRRRRRDSSKKLSNCKVPIPDLDSAIADTGSTSIYLTHKAPYTNINTKSPKILVARDGKEDPNPPSCRQEEVEGQRLLLDLCPWRPRQGIAAPTTMINRRTMSLPQPEQVQTAQGKISTRSGLTGSCDRMGGSMA